MTKALRAPRLLKTAPIAVEQALKHTSTHRESDDNYQWVAALPEKARAWRTQDGAIQ